MSGGPGELHRQLWVRPADRDRAELSLEFVVDGARTALMRVARQFRQPAAGQFVPLPLVLLARWPADKALRHARERVRELTDRSVGRGVTIVPVFEDYLRRYERRRWETLLPEA